MKKIISIIVALVMLASLCTVTALNTSAAWAGGVATGFAGGTGTEADPYQIASSIELALLAKMVNEDGDTCEGKYFKIIADIDLGGINWDPIGNYINKTEIFKGHVDGDGHTVSGLHIENDAAYVGLFGRTVGASFKNLTVKGDLVASTYEGKTSYVGSVAAYGIDSAKFINCHADVALVKGTTVGGIVGRTQNSAGILEWAEIRGCSFNGKIEGVTNKNTFAAGIVGACGATYVKYCANYGNVDIPVGATTMGLAGGIVGVQGAENVTSHISNCVNTGDITAISGCDATYAGGIVGRSAHIADYVAMADVKSCFSTSKNVVVKDASGSPIDGKFGSIIGHIRNLATVANCYTCVPFADVPEVGTDDMVSIEDGSVIALTEAQMKGADAVATMKLGSAWIAGSDAPTIDYVKALTATDDEPAAEDTTPAPEETTTPAPEVTTPASEETTTPAPEVTTPAAEETTPAPTEDETTPAPTVDDTDDNQGGGSKTILFVLIGVVAVGAVVAIVIVVVGEKKKAK